MYCVEPLAKLMIYFLITLLLEYNDYNFVVRLSQSYDITRRILIDVCRNMIAVY